MFPDEGLKKKDGGLAKSKWTRIGKKKLCQGSLRRVTQRISSVSPDSRCGVGMLYGLIRLKNASWLGLARAVRPGKLGAGGMLSGWLGFS